MRFYHPILILALMIFTACADSAPKTETPLDALKAYIQAIKKKDTTQMKLLLTEGSLKMADEEAKAQNVVLDEIIKRETLFSESQSRVEFKNQKIDGDKATIEVKNSYGSWDIVPFTKENGEWKIAKDRYLEEQTKKAEEEMKRLDEQINQSSPDSITPTNQTPPEVMPTQSENPDSTPQPATDSVEQIPTATPAPN